MAAIYSPLRSIALCLCIVASSKFLVLAQDRSSEIEHVTLRNAQLAVTLSTPASSDNYQGTRFDHSGIFHKIEFAGHSICQRWHVGPLNTSANDDVTGPCEEFGNSNPLGYRDNSPNSSFLKIGVGILEQVEEERYRFWYPYPFVRRGTWEVEKAPQSVSYRQSLQLNPEIGYSYAKVIELRENGFQIRHLLKNTGSSIWSTDHYNHNFFLVDGDLVGPNYKIEFNFQLEPTRVQAQFKELVSLQGKLMGFQRTLADKESYFAELVGHSKRIEDHSFTIHHLPSGIRIRCQGDAPLSKLNVWGMKNTICPEPYVDIPLKPGETREWKLTYEISKSKP